MTRFPYVGGPWHGEIATIVTDKYDVIRVEMPKARLALDGHLSVNETVTTHHYRLKALDDESGKRQPFWLHDSISDSEVGVIKSKLREAMERSAPDPTPSRA